MRIVLLTNIPNPYRVPLFNEIDRRLRRTGGHLKVIFAAKGYRRRLFRLDPEEMEFDFEILPSIKIKVVDSEKVTFTYSRLIGRIRVFQPDLLVAVGFSPGAFKVMIYSLLHRVPYMIWNGSTATRKYSLLRQLSRKILVKRASGFIAYGTEARAYLMGLGAAEERMTIAFNTVDTSFFRSETAIMRHRMRAVPDDKHHLTTVGYLTRRKNVGRLLRAIAKLLEQRKDIVLDVIGDGDQRQNLEQYVERHGLDQWVKFHGFVQKEELPYHLARSRCFLFQTDFDIWGLALTEAMAAGLPCIASIHAGAVEDIIEEGVTGFRVDFRDRARVVDRINWVLDNPHKSAVMGRRAQDFIEKKVSLHACADRFVSALARCTRPALDKPVPQRGIIL
jgi:glycosyltransferase involved in cell wall biosynthesis